MHARHCIGGLCALALVALATMTAAGAESDPYTEEARRWLGFVNRDCGTSMVESGDKVYKAISR